MQAEAQNTQAEQKRQEFMKKAGEEMFDMMAYDLPEELKRRVVFPKCRHCHRRPELIKRKDQEFHIQLRPYSPQTVRIDGYELLPCCTAAYEQARRITEISRLQRRQAIDRQKLNVTQGKGALPGVAKGY